MPVPRSSYRECMLPLAFVATAFGHRRARLGGVPVPEDAQVPEVGYPSESDLLGADPLLPWIDEHFLRLDPFAFRAVGFRPFVQMAVEEFGVDANGIFLIGSGAVGLSLNPANIREGRLARFSSESDLDVALVSEVHFEAAWRDLRRAAQPTVAVASSNLTENLNWQRKKFFDGAIIANKLLPELSFGASWLTAGVRLSERVATLLNREVEVNYWIYRDYWSVRNYVAKGVVECRKKVLV